MSVRTFGAPDYSADFRIYPLQYISCLCSKLISSISYTVCMEILGIIRDVMQLFNMIQHIAH